MIMSIVTLLGALGLFLYGMRTMSDGLERAAGDKLRRFMASLTSRPAKGMLTGLATTAVIQSSSATTVMVVSFVSAGLLTLSQAISVIMGANIGTTMTAWIVSLCGFNMDISTLALPVAIVGCAMSVSKRAKLRDIGNAVMGFSILFLGLAFMKSSVPDLQSMPQTLSFIRACSGHGLGSVLLFCIIGTALTLVLQSSSATVALTLVLLDMGWIGFDMAAAMVLGENIGTTITANIAATMGNANAKRAALAHTIFNMVGVAWAILLFRPFLSLVQWTVNLCGLGGSAQTPLYSLSMLHTMFNVINTCLLIWFIPQIRDVVCAIVKDRPQRAGSQSKAARGGTWQSETPGETA